jgi:glycerol-3-phosphate acyltransferase PlsY
LRRLCDLLQSGEGKGAAVDAELIAGPLAALLIGYLLGSIPFGVVLTRLSGAGDVRNIGSGNIGATNVLRTGRKGLAAATLLLDLLKGSAAVVLGESLFAGTGAAAAVAALIGHMWPVWLRFRGGKGVSTYMGLLVGFTILGELSWMAPLAYAAAWIGILALTRYSSAGGLAAAAAAPIAAALLGRIDLAIVFLGFTLLVFWKHRDNIARLASGTESKVGSARHA